MPKDNVASKPKFPVLSNGGLSLAVSQILFTRNRIKLFSETDLAFNLHF
jgi:hypothetical protein